MQPIQIRLQLALDGESHYVRLVILFCGTNPIFRLQKHCPSVFGSSPCLGPVGGEPAIFFAEGAMLLWVMALDRLRTTRPDARLAGRGHLYSIQGLSTP